MWQGRGRDGGLISHTLMVRRRVAPSRTTRPVAHPSRRRLAPPQRLSWVSSALPWSIVPQDGVEDGEKLSGDGDQGHHFRLTDGDQTLVEVFQRRIASTGDEGCHEGGGPNSGAPPSAHAPAAPA